MAQAIAFLGFILLAGFLYLRMLRAREANPNYEPPARPEKRLNRRERKLAKIREYDDEQPTIPSMQELMMEEVRETGVDRIPGGDGLEIPVRLKVWHRDRHVRQGCAANGLRFVVTEGVDRERADIDDVMLVCDVPSDEPAADPWADAAAPVDEPAPLDADSDTDTG